VAHFRMSVFILSGSVLD